MKILIVFLFTLMTLNAQTNYEFNKIPLSTERIEGGIKIGNKLYFKTVYIETYPQVWPYFYLDSYDLISKKYKTGILDSYNTSHNLRYYRFYNHDDSLLIYKSQDLMILNSDYIISYKNFEYDSTKILSSHYNSITKDENNNIYLLKLDNKNFKSKDYDSTKGSRQMKIYKYFNNEFTLLYTDDDIKEAHHITYYENKLFIIFKKDTTNTFDLLQFDLKSKEKVIKQYNYPTNNDFNNINFIDENTRFYINDIIAHNGKIYTYFQLSYDSGNTYSFFEIDLTTFDVKYIELLKSDVSDKLLNILDYTVYNDVIICYTNSDQLDKNKILCKIDENNYKYIPIENNNLKASIYGWTTTPQSYNYTFENNKMPIRYDFHINESGTLCGFTSDGYVEIENVFTTSSVEKQILTPKIYPNPANESITIAGIRQGKVEIYNTLGQKLIEKEITGTTHLNTSELQTGLYIIKLESGGEVVFEKVIVNR